MRFTSSAAKIALFVGFAGNVIVYNFAPDLRQPGGDVETILLIQSAFLAGLLSARYLFSPCLGRE